MKAHVKLVEKTKAIRNAVLMLAISFVAIPAQAATLHGYVSDTADSASARIYSAAVQEAVAPARADSFPAELQGSWECVSTVIDSLVDTVQPGQQVVSRLNFVKVDDGRIMARFQQPGWTETQASVTAYSTASYVMDKTNFYYGDQTNGGWAARSRDHYQVVDLNKMLAESEVDQYVGGQYVGRYRTRSTLVRIGGFENVAMGRAAK
ncbi:MAG: hypothetical protein K2X77_34055 [Candidatus Obscuribacterales bacterium]|nr:hypothetical protein [Candidatus Obscuribacterales bacterium]